MMSLRKEFSSALILLFALTPSHAQSHSYSADDLIAHYADSLSRLNTPVRFKASSERKHSGDWNWKMAETHRIETALAWRRNGDIAYRVESEFQFQANDSGKTKALERNHVSATNRVLSYQASESDIPAEQFQSLAIYKDPANYNKFLHLPLGEHGQVLDGRMPGEMGVPLPELLSAGDARLNVKSVLESVDGAPCILLTAETKYGQHTLWLDPEKGFLPRRIECVRTIGDFHYEQELGKAVPGHPQGNVSKQPSAALESETIVVDGIEIEEMNGIFWPVSANIRTEERYADGSILKSETAHRRSEFQFDPDFEADGAFSPEVPNGTPVSYRDSDEGGHLSYQWVDGAVVPIVNIDHEQEIKAIMAEIEELPTTNLEQHAAVTSTTAATVGNDGSSSGGMAMWIAIAAISIVVLLAAGIVTYRWTQS